MKRFLGVQFLMSMLIFAKGQTTTGFADSIRIAYKIPELAFAVVSADSIFELHTIGKQRINANYKANPNDRFHIGSNTKAITSFIAALLVDQGKIKWDTKIFDLFPDLKFKSNKAYQAITLENLLTFRGRLPAYTYTFDKPAKKEITGDNATQRFMLAKYFLLQNPMKKQNGLTPSNADYILAGLMLEKATGKSYKELVTTFGKTEGIDIGYGYPNLSDTLQPWGHDKDLKPQLPVNNYKMDWLLCAGNINISLPDYIKFIQLLLKGLKGNSTLLTKQLFQKLLFGLPHFSFGWFNKIDPETTHQIAYNEGNAGAFITQIQIINEADRAYILFTNSATAETQQGMAAMMNYLQAKYGK